MRVAKEAAPPKGNLFEVLRDDIVRGRLQPGQRLKAALLAKDHDASLTVIREALNRLAGEKLVDFEPQVGFSVRQMSAADLLDLTEQRIVWETVALRRCMEAASVEWQSEVLAAHHRLARTPMVEASGELSVSWLERHDDFHAVVLQACGSARLFRTIRQMAHEAAIYHRALLPVVASDQEMEDEHKGLVDAILDGDVEGAIKLLAQHQEKTRDQMLPLLQELALMQ